MCRSRTTRWGTAAFVLAGLGCTAEAGPGGIFESAGLTTTASDDGGVEGSTAGLASGSTSSEPPGGLSGGPLDGSTGAEEPTSSSTTAAESEEPPVVPFDPLGGMDRDAERVTGPNMRMDLPRWWSWPRGEAPALHLTMDSRTQRLEGEALTPTDIEGRCLGTDESGRLYCFAQPDGEPLVLVRHDDDGPAPIATSFEGGPIPGPNDGVVSDDGVVYFTNRCAGHSPCSGAPADATGGVYAIIDGEVREVHRGDIIHPNGIALSGDGSTLYVSASSYSDPAGRQIYAMDRLPDDTVSAPVVFAGVDRRPDGIAVDAHDNVFVSYGNHDRVDVFAPDGTMWGRVKASGTLTNCVIGGVEGRTLYITTSGKGLYALELEAAS